MDADLAETIDMITRAIGIIEREMSKHSFVQSGHSMDKVTVGIGLEVAIGHTRSSSSLESCKIEASLLIALSSVYDV